MAGRVPPGRLARVAAAAEIVDEIEGALPFLQLGGRRLTAGDGAYCGKENDAEVLDHWILLKKAA